MGTLTLPTSGSVYVDANSVIYGVEKHPVYGPLLQPLWDAATAKVLEIVSSELVLMETLIGPFKSGDKPLASAYEAFFQQPQTRLIPISHAILRRAAQLRATTKLKTPDALHAATGMEIARQGARVSRARRSQLIAPTTEGPPGPLASSVIAAEFLLAGR